MIQAFFIAQTDKFFVAVSGLAAYASGQWFLAAGTDDWLSKYGSLGLVAVFTSVATVFFKSRKDTINAISNSEVAKAAVLAQTTKDTIQQMKEGYIAHIEMLGLDLDYARRRADTAEQIQHQEREGKHAALEVLFPLVNHARSLEEILRMNQIEFPRGPDIPYGKVVRAQDAPTARLLTDRIAANEKSRKTQQIIPPSAQEG